MSSFICISKANTYYPNIVSCEEVLESTSELGGYSLSTEPTELHLSSQLNSYRKILQSHQPGFAIEAEYASSTASPGYVTIEGYVLYHDDQGKTRKAVGAYLEMWDSDWEFDDLLDSAYTNSEGYFVLGPVKNVDSEFGESGTLDLYIKFFARNWAADVKSPGLLGDTYEGQTEVWWDTPDGEHRTDYLLTGDLQGAFHILGVLTFGNWYVSLYDTTPSVVTVRWAPDYDTSLSKSYYQSGTIHLQGLSNYDQWDECVILHEYGHFIMDKYFHTSMEQGDKYIKEGWAQFFQSPVRHYWDFVDRYDDYPPEVYNDPQSFRQNLEQTTSGDEYELLSSILWDIYDETSDDQDGDGIGDTLFLGYTQGFEKIWKVFKNYNPKTIDEFWDYWFVAGYNHGREMACIFYEHGIDKSPWVIDWGDDDDVYDSDMTDYKLWVEGRHPNGWKVNIAYGWGPAYGPPSSPYKVIYDAAITTSSTFSTLEFYIPRSEIIANMYPEGITLWWKYEAVDLIWGASLGWSDWIKGGRCFDDDFFGPSITSPSSTGNVYDSYSGTYRIGATVTDQSGVYIVKFRYRFDSSWSEWFPASDSSGSYYWYDIPRSEWVSHVSSTIYFQVYAEDYDGDRANDRAVTLSDEYAAGTIRDDDATGPSFFNPWATGNIQDSHNENYRIQISASDPSGIYVVKFRYRFGGGTWSEWCTYSGSSGSSFWYDIPRSVWVNHVGQTLSWQALAYDDDNDRPNDQADAISPESIMYYLTVSFYPDDGGSVSPGSGWFDSGSQVKIQAYPNEGYVFSKWVGLGAGSYNGSNNPAMITIIGSITEVAHFTKIPILTITTNPWLNNIHFKIDNAKYYVTYHGNLTVELERGVHIIELINKTVIEHEGTKYEFSHWSGASSGSQSWVQIDITGDTSLTANFETYYKVSFTQAGVEQGSSVVITVDGEEHQGHTIYTYDKWILSGDYVSFEISSIIESSISGKRYVFDQWKDSEGYTVTSPQMIDKPEVFTAYYTTEYRLEISTVPEGLTTPQVNPTGLWYTEGTQVTCIATQLEGYNFDYWIFDGIQQEAGKTELIIIMDSSHQAIAHYTPITTETWIFPVQVGTETYNVAIESNSTVSNFYFDEDEGALTFLVEGPSGTKGFCEVVVPAALMQNPFTVKIDGATILENHYAPTNGTHYFVQFTYIHTTHTIEIIPEFTPTILVLTTILTLTTIAFVKKKAIKYQNKT